MYGCSEDNCGPEYGCNCGPCQKLDQEEQEEKEKEAKRPKVVSAMIDSWIWGSPPGNVK